MKLSKTISTATAVTTTAVTATARPASAGRRGMSVVEVLIAAGLLLFIALGILALLTRSVANINRGWEATSGANMVRTQLDTHLGEPFDSNGVTIAAGSGEKKTELVWAAGSEALDNDDDEGWYADDSAAQGRVLMEQTRTVRQYNVKSLLGEPTEFNDKGEFVYEITQGSLDSGLTGDVDQSFIHVKRIEVVYEGRRSGGPLGAGQRLKTDTFKSF